MKRSIEITIDFSKMDEYGLEINHDDFLKTYFYEDVLSKIYSLRTTLKNHNIEPNEQMASVFEAIKYAQVRTYGE